jgi:hypothetical protein
VLCLQLECEIRLIVSHGPSQAGRHQFDPGRPLQQTKSENFSGSLQDPIPIKCVTAAEDRARQFYRRRKLIGDDLPSRRRETF